MLYEFIIIIGDKMTGEEQRHTVCKPATFGYFEAWAWTLEQAKALTEEAFNVNKYAYLKGIENIPN